MHVPYQSDEHVLGKTERLTRIRDLNNALRAKAGTGGIIGDRLHVTSGVSARGEDFVARALTAVRSYDDFTPQNDPYGEQDFGSFEVDGIELYWKIDYFDEDFDLGSPDPADDIVTRRVLTVMLAEEY